MKWSRVIISLSICDTYIFEYLKLPRYLSLEVGNNIKYQQISTNWYLTFFAG